MLEIIQFPCRHDNYGFVLRDRATGTVACIDTPDADETLRQLALRGWPLHLILNTHWHADHTGGNLALKAATGARIIGPAAEGDRIPGIDQAVQDSDTMKVGNVTFTVLHTPGHTHGHCVYYSAQAGVAFVGDVIFVMGCGRVFEGTMDSARASLQRIAALPPETRLYCAHEYSASNARFALHSAPDDRAIQSAAAAIFAQREAGQPTVPTTVAAERASNLFIRANDVTAFTALRVAKDQF